MMPTQRYSPAIVVLTHKRKESLSRLLDSVSRSVFPPDQDIHLYLSMDGADPDVLCICDAMVWPFGPKTVLKTEESVGVRNHVFNCCKLVEDHDSIIMLEDDLYVSRYFYSYTLDALQYYGEMPEIAGGALFHHQLNETAKRAFTPIHDGSDVYFLQLAASWGQFWTAPQWKRFAEWCEPRTFEDIQATPIPWDIKKWPWSSWKKWFTAYLEEENKYVLYPRFSLSTNFMESGAHNPRKGYDLQTELECSPRNWRFIAPEASLARYDSYCEIVPDVLKEKNPALRDYNFEVDFYGVKRLESISKPFVLTSRPVRKSIVGFEQSLRPLSVNVINNLPGNGINLCRKEDCVSNWEPSLRDEINYHFKVPDKLLGRMIHQHMERISVFNGLIILCRLVWQRLLLMVKRTFNRQR